MTTVTSHHVDLAISGRVTAAAIDSLAAAMAPALDTGTAFTVLFDRRAMTAFTPDGREALDAWWSRVETGVNQRCAGWADLYDERRAASLRGSSHTAASAHPQAVFAAESAARAWLALLLSERLDGRLDEQARVQA